MLWKRFIVVNFIVIYEQDHITGLGLLMLEAAGPRAIINHITATDAVPMLSKKKAMSNNFCQHSIIFVNIFGAIM